MDEEIIQRIIYIVLGIILFSILSAKKKPADKQVTTQPPQTNAKPSTEQNTNQEIFTPVEKIDIGKTKNVSTAKKDILEEIIHDEIYEDETIADHRIIKKQTSIHKHTDIKQEKHFQITHDDLKKAVILSDIIQPKYF
ncbi:MAG: hypothetical protein N2449_05990 [Bacteroidales bacterium]|nr:hypothetical protein [Bacteroidales bacterium]